MSPPITTYGQRPYGEITPPQVVYGQAGGFDALPQVSEDITWDSYVRADFRRQDAGGSGRVSQLIDPLTGAHWEQGDITQRGIFNATGWSTGKPTVDFDGALTAYEGNPDPTRPAGKSFGYVVFNALSVPTDRWYHLDSQGTTVLYTLANNALNVGAWDASWRDSGTKLTTGEHIVAWEHIAGTGLVIHYDGAILATVPFNNRALGAPAAIGADDLGTSYHCHYRLAEHGFGRGGDGAGLDEISSDDKDALNDYSLARYDKAIFGS